MAIYVGDKRYAPYIGDKRREVRNKKALPYDAEVEYIRCTGTQMIDTGFVMGQKNVSYGLGEIKIKKRYNNKPSNWCGDGGNGTIFGMMGGSLGIQWSSNQSKDFISFDTDWHEYYLNIMTNFGAVDNVTKNNVPTNITNSSTFKVNGYQVGRNTSTDTEFLQLWDKNSDLVFDGIPVRKGRGGYLYDRVSGNLFGTGDFIYGPDKN